MTHIWLGLSTCQLQAYPSRMLTLFSLRTDNVPKRCFHDNNIGQGSGIALLSMLCQEQDQLSSVEAFLGLSKQNPNYTCQLFFQAPPRDATKLSLLQIDQELLNLYLQSTANTDRSSGPCCLVLLFL